ncbi:MAG: 4Fe-4S dicluster domain-containing protein [Herpetosiphonaceae bacterium]|nr:4Fe-4S dicluster domain-containing protein [Herpetosiphonaceae bacterium]
MSDAYGFYTDTTVCIGCKACQVACHQWNELPAELEQQPTEHSPGQTRPMTGNSYDNTGSFSDVNWRHVKFIEKSEIPAMGTTAASVSHSPQDPNRDNLQWLMMSDVCKHCVNAPCLEVCPTGAIIRTEFDSVYIQEPVCNGCRNCVGACPFGVIHMGGTANEGEGTAKKCTLCYDRMQHGLTPACAQACPTESIQFGKITDLKVRAEQRVKDLHDLGFPQAQLYGADTKILGGLNSFYLLMDQPEVYGLPSNPKLPSRAVIPSTFLSMGSALLVALGGLFAFRKKRMEEFAADPTAKER